MSTVEQLAQQVLALGPEERVYLANVLEESLSTGGFASPELAAAWSAEIDRRLAAYRRGETQGTDADAALERIGQRLEEHRARKAGS
jgi:putative addiction module component (TIGR02574 family)